MASDRNELLLQVPSDLIVNGKGLALDIGGSVLKFVYRSKEDYDDAVQNSPNLSSLHLVSFGRNELKEGLEYVRQKAYLLREADDEPLTLYTTGVGCTNFGKSICATLNIKIENLTEFDCFIKSFVYLAERLPRGKLLQPFLHDALTDPVEQMESGLAMFEAMKDKNLTQAFDIELPPGFREGLLMGTGRHPAANVDAPVVDQPLSEAELDTYPCILAMCGSGFAFMKVNEDKTFQVLDGMNRAGKGFYGVGSLLTGCKSFEELVELASHGDKRKVDQFSDQACDKQDAAEGDESVYSMAHLMKPQLMFCFGHVANGRRDFSREDLAASWLQWVAMDLVQSLTYCCQINNVKRVFFCGGFCQEEVVRSYLTTEMARRNLAVMTLFKNSGCGPVTFDFIKPGQHLGALGCMLNGIEKFVGK